MMLATDETFFFDQAPYKQPQKRYKKNADELPQSLRYAHLNPKLASFYKDSKSGEEDNAGEPEGDGVKDSILPDISTTFASIRNQLLSGFMPDYDSTRLALQESKAATPGLIEELAKLLPLVKLSRKKLSYPRSLEHNLQSSYDDLVYDAKYVKRQWQLLENQIKHDAEEKEKAQKEAASQAEETKKSKVEFSDSDDELARMEMAEMENSRSKTRSRRRKHRQTQSQPAVIIEEEPLAKGAAGGRKSRTNSALRKPATAPGKHDSNRLAAPRGAGEEVISEASHSVRSGLPSTHPQPYSMTVLAFNLSNYHTWEDKGCHVFGIDKSADNEHPLEWVVKRLNKTSSEIKLQQEEAARNKFTQLPYTRYYTDNFNEKAMLKSAGDRLGIFNTVMKGGKPRIPNLKHKPNRGQVLSTQITNGSNTIYYETGEVAVITSHSGDKGFYTLCYDKEEPSRMLASFTPLGTGCCYSPKNNPILLVTETGGLLTIDEDNTEEWMWPASPSTKLNTPINIQLNRQLSVKVVSRSSITLTFQSAIHTIKLSVGLTEGLEYTDSPVLEDLFPLQTTFTFTSNAALELIQRHKITKAPSVYEKNPAGSMLRKSRTVRTPKKEDSVSVDFSDAATVVIQYDITKVEREFNKLKNKAKNLVDDWLDAYRIALGMATPQLKNMKLTSDWSRHGLHTAKSLPPDAQNYNADELASTPIPTILDTERSARAPSAPSGYGPWMYASDKNTANDFSAPRLSAREKNSSNILRQSKSTSSSLKLPTGLEKPKMSPDSPKIQGLMSEWTLANHYQCPVALRQQLLGYSISGPHVCKCTRRRVPYITDVELETFITQIVPRKQLIVLSIVSSLFPEKNRGGEMLDRLHNERNANRAHTCMQSRCDPYRVFRYDVVTAYFDSNHTQPLLLTRHNAVPGMFLIFQAGRLVFCDHIFNGYGNAKKDFQKQLVDCRKLAYQGFSLPKDFKFSPQRGKQGPRSPWGGQIGGAGVDKYGSPGTTMPRIELKDRTASPDSVSSLEYHIGKNMSKEEADVHTSKTLVSRLTKRYARIMPPATEVK